MRLNIPLDPTRTGPDAEKLEKNLKRLIIGQPEAIAQIVNIYQMYLTGLCPPDRPVGSFLFLGPTGSGKTRIVEATAQSLVGNHRAVIKIDCAEFQHSHEIAKLVGSPPGYLGHRETHPLLSQETLDQHHTDTVKLSFVLFDEIEKANDAVWNLLLGILDKATLTLGDNRRVDFSQAMIFMTSNLGATEMESMLSPRMGLGSHSGIKDSLSSPDSRTAAKVAKSGLEAARRKFTPEFINRLSKIVVFRHLSTEDLRKVLDIELGFVQQRILSASDPNKGFIFRASEQAKSYLLREGTDYKYGSRHLKRAIERLLVHPLSNLISTGQIRGGDAVWVDFDSNSGQISFIREAEGLPMHVLASMLETTVRFTRPTRSRSAAADTQSKSHSVRSSRLD